MKSAATLFCNVFFLFLLELFVLIHMNWFKVKEPTKPNIPNTTAWVSCTDNANIYCFLIIWYCTKMNAYKHFLNNVK